MNKASCRYGVWSVFLLCAFLWAGDAHAARIRLTSGGSIRGDIDRLAGDEIHVRIKIGVVGFSLERVVSVEAGEEEVRPVYEATLARLEKGDARGRMHLGVFCELSGLRAEAVVLYQEALKIDPQLKEATEKLEELKAKMAAEAREEGQRTAKAKVMVEVGRELAGAGKHAEAMHAFESAVELVPGLVGELKKELLRLYVILGDEAMQAAAMDDALEVYRKALALEPQDELREKWEGLMLARGLFFLEAGDKQQAFNSFTQVRKRSIGALRERWKDDLELLGLLKKLFNGELRTRKPDDRLIIVLDDEGLAPPQQDLRWCMDKLGVGRTKFDTRDFASERTGVGSPPQRPTERPMLLDARRPVPPDARRPVPPRIPGPAGRGSIPGGYTQDPGRDAVLPRGPIRRPGDRSPAGPSGRTPARPAEKMPDFWDFRVTGKLVNTGNAPAHHVTMYIGGMELVLDTIVPGEAAEWKGDFTARKDPPRPRSVSYTSELGFRKTAKP